MISNLSKKVKAQSLTALLQKKSECARNFCLFKPDYGGSRNGNIVLVENIDIQDTDFNSAFTIKTYTSVKETKEEGWQHNSILLRPNSFDSSYKDIIVNEENGSGMRVVGEFVCIIK